MAHTGPSDPAGTPANPAPDQQPIADTPTERQERRFHRGVLFSGRTMLLLDLFLLTTFGVLAFLALGLEPLAFDVPVTLTLQRMQFAGFGGLMVAVSALGFWPWLVIMPLAIALLFAGLRLPWEAAWVLLAAISSTTSELIKVLVQRPRPTPDLVAIAAPLHTYSFPSGHVTSYVTFYGFLFYLAYSGMKPGPWRTAILVVCGALILLVGPSRVWMGQHWASDALGGYALGFFLLLVLIRLHRAWTARRLAASQGSGQTARSA